MKCNKCGAEIDDDSRYCDQCGARLVAGVRSKKLLMVAAIAIVVVAAGVLLALLLPRANETKEPNEPKTIEQPDLMAAENETLRRQLAQRDSTIESLRAEVKKLNKKVSGLERSVNAYADELKDNTEMIW